MHIHPTNLLAGIRYAGFEKLARRRHLHCDDLVGDLCLGRCVVFKNRSAKRLKANANGSRKNRYLEHETTKVVLS